MIEEEGGGKVVRTMIEEGNEEGVGARAMKGEGGGEEALIIIEGEEVLIIIEKEEVDEMMIKDQQISTEEENLLDHFQVQDQILQAIKVKVVVEVNQSHRNLCLQNNRCHKMKLIVYNANNGNNSPIGDAPKSFNDIL